MEFEDALRELKAGKRITNKHWNGSGMCLHMQTPDEFSKMTLPYIYMKNTHGDLVPWLASQMDLFSDAWQIVQE